jgi:ankyrin repeat protein
MWLRDELARNHEGARVLLYGYETDLVQSESFQDIDDIGRTLVNKIQSMRKPQFGEINHEPRPIIFVAHSLGGLVVQDAVHRMYTDDQVNYFSVYGCLFFGVPSQGIQASHWLPIVQDHPNEALVRNLQPHSTYLRTLRENFHQVFRFNDARVVSIYETQRSKTAEKDAHGVWKLTGATEILVSRESAQASFPPEPRHTALGFNQNHADLPKFSGEYDDAYRSIEPFLNEFRHNAVPTIQTRFASMGFTSKKLQLQSNKEQPGLERPKTPLNDPWGGNQGHNGPMYNPGMDYLTSQRPLVNWYRNQSPFPLQQQMYPNGAQTISPPILPADSYNGMALAQTPGMTQNLQFQHPAFANALLMGNTYNGFMPQSPFPPPPSYDDHQPTKGQEQAIEKAESKAAIEQVHAPDTSQEQTALPQPASEVTTSSGPGNAGTTDSSHDTHLESDKYTGRDQNASPPGEMMEVKPEVSQSTGTFQCRKCSECFTAKPGLLQHLKTSRHQADVDTALYSAAVGGNAQDVQLLIDQGASVEVRRQGGWRALHRAAFKGHVEVTKLLLESGATVDSTTPDKCTPLLLAVEGDHEEIVRMLLHKGANRSATDSNGLNALHYAAFSQGSEMTRYLLHAGLRVDATTSAGRTALHIAAESGGIKNIKLLLENGADIAARDEVGLTPLQCAESSSRGTAIVKLLRKNTLAQKDTLAPINLSSLELNDGGGPQAAPAPLISCGVCNSRFDTRNQLFKHLKITGHDSGNIPQRQDSNELRCHTCNWKFSTHDQLVNHEDANGHGKPAVPVAQDADPLHCLTCNTSFPSRTQLFKHLKTSGHDNGSTPQIQNPNESQCATCSWKFSTHDQLVNHQDASGHGKPAMPRADSTSQYRNPQLPEKRCLKCNAYFHSRTQLFAHLRASGHDKDA